MNTQIALTDIPTLRDRARKHIEDGAVTSGYTADRVAVLSHLNTALATELAVAERIAIESYRELIQYLGDQDPTTSHMLRSILATEEGEHADELSDLLANQPTRN